MLKVSDREKLKAVLERSRLLNVKRMLRQTSASESATKTTTRNIQAAFAAAVSAQIKLLLSKNKLIEIVTGVVIAAFLLLLMFGGTGCSTATSSLPGFPEVTVRDNESNIPERDWGLALMIYMQEWEEEFGGQPRCGLHKDEIRLYLLGDIKERGDTGNRLDGYADDYGNVVIDVQNEWPLLPNNSLDPTGPQDRLPSATALAHEFTHVCLRKVEGDPDINHAEPGGPWSVVHDDLILRASQEMVRRCL